MAILIEGVKIPDTCIDCPCLHTTLASGSYCSITDSKTDTNRLAQNKRNEDCPMTDVLEPKYSRQIPFKYVVSDYVLHKR